MFTRTMYTGHAGKVPAKVFLSVKSLLSSKQFSYCLTATGPQCIKGRIATNTHVQVKEEYNSYCLVLTNGTLQSKTACVLVIIVLHLSAPIYEKVKKLQILLSP